MFNWFSVSERERTEQNNMMQQMNGMGGQNPRQGGNYDG